MKNPAPKRKKLSPPKKVLKSPFKTIGKIIKKIRGAGKKITLRPRVSVKPPKEKLVIKKSFSKIVKSRPSPLAVEGSHPAEAWQSDRRLPEYYAEDKLVLLVRDPWWLFGYWEVTPGRQAQVLADLSSNGLGVEKTVLRVYDITGTSIEAPITFFDIEINYLNSNWYIDVGQPDREWIAEIGFRTHGGQFFTLVRSNAVKTPSFGISDVLDEEWMMPDEMYFKLLGVIGGLEGAGSSMEIRKLLEKYVRHSVSSHSSPKIPNA